MARHGENIYKRKDGRYEGRYVIGKTPTGRTRFGYVYGRQYSEVRQILIQNFFLPGYTEDEMQFSPKNQSWSAP